MQTPLNKPLVALCAALFSLFLWIAATVPSVGAQQPDQKPKQSLTQDQRGERVFDNNCARCHRPPMTIPPQATGTVIMHMRVRARLSSQEEKDLLHYLAP
jgi:mono/diheme cytochrome c family protein